MMIEKAPPLRNLWQGGEGRRLWRRYWFRNLPLDLLQYVLFHLYGLLPTDLVSKIGGLGALLIIPRLYPEMVERTLTNLRRLQPSWNEERLRDVAFRHFDSLGRMNAEFTILHRLVPSGRVELDNEDLVLRTLDKGPIVLVGIHTGNWEVIGPLAGRYGIPGFYIHQPQLSPMQNHLLQKARLRSAAQGTLTLTPGPAAGLEALRTLKAGKSILILCDEAVKQQTIVPFFGRRPHLESNYSVAVRLARKARAPIILFHCVRHDGCRFKVKFGPLMKMSGADDGKAAVLEDVIRLNNLIEPIVRDHLDQWYWLNWPMREDHGHASAAPVYGYIDEYRDGVLAGWCRLPDSNDVVSVDIVINNAKVMTVPADIYREDLHKLGFGAGTHGFRAILPSVEADATVKVVVAGTEFSLENSGRRLSELGGPAA